MKRVNIDNLIALVPSYLPCSEPLFPEEMITDRSENFRAAEVVREKLTLALRQEIPYGLTVQIERFERDDKGILINAIIWVERDSQKGIVVGYRDHDLHRVRSIDLPETLPRGDKAAQVGDLVADPSVEGRSDLRAGQHQFGIA